MAALGEAALVRKNGKARGRRLRRPSRAACKIRPNRVALRREKGERKNRRGTRRGKKTASLRSLTLLTFGRSPRRGADESTRPNRTASGRKVPSVPIPQVRTPKKGTKKSFARRTFARRKGDAPQSRQNRKSRRKEAEKTEANSNDVQKKTASTLRKKTRPKSNAKSSAKIQTVRKTSSENRERNAPSRR